MAKAINLMLLVILTNLQVPVEIIPYLQLVLVLYFLYIVSNCLAESDVELAHPLILTCRDARARLLRHTILTFD